MDAQALDRIVGSVLYEGYLLYPYRQSLKNIKRWTFGSLYPTWSSEWQLQCRAIRLLGATSLFGIG